MLRIALAQVNFRVGDIAGNSKKILRWTEKARKAQADVVAFPELAISGYPPEDLLFKKHFLVDCADALDALAERRLDRRPVRRPERRVDRADSAERELRWP